MYILFLTCQKKLTKLTFSLQVVISYHGITQRKAYDCAQTIHGLYQLLKSSTPTQLCGTLKLFIPICCPEMLENLKLAIECMENNRAIIN